MGEMDGLDSVSFVKAGAKVIRAAGRTLDPKCKAIMEQVDKGMKASTEEQKALLGQPFKTRPEARRKARYINNQISLMGADFSRYIAKPNGNDQSGYQVSIYIKKPGSSTGKGKGKTLPLRQASKPYAAKSKPSTTTPLADKPAGLRVKDSPAVRGAKVKATPAVREETKQSDLPGMVNEPKPTGEHGTAVYGNTSLLDAQITKLENELAEAKTEEDKAAKTTELEKSKANLADIKKFLGITSEPNRINPNDQIPNNYAAGF